MPNAKEIKTQIGSVQNTQKITHAMEMVAASKLRKAQDRMQRSKPYAEKIRDVVRHLAYAHPEYHHPYLEVRTVQRAGAIIVSTDRGLCGPLNSNLFRFAMKDLKAYQEQSVATDLCLIGHKAQTYFQRTQANITATAQHLGDAPGIDQLVGIVKVMLDAYKNHDIDSLDIYYNEFVTTMNQKPKKIQLLPITPMDDEEADQHRQGHWDYIYEPEANIILDRLLKYYIESQVYQSVVENIACQQAATMIAMKNATDNANKIIDDLRLQYNKARQAAITREISEIISGAEAVS